MEGAPSTRFGLAGLGRDTLFNLAAVPLVLITALSIASQSAPPLLAVIALGLLFVFARWSWVSLLACFGTILFDAAGNIGLSLAGRPVTLSQLTVATSVAAWGLRTTLLRESLLQRTPISAPQLGVLGSMLLSTAASISPEKAVQPIISVTMLTMMVHFLYRAFDLHSTRTVLRICATALVVALVISVATVGEGRDSGTFNNPNAWAGIILLLSPLAVGVLAEWDAPVGNLLLLALLGLFPVAILQSASRSGLVLLVLGSPFVLWLMRKHPWKVAVAILIGAVVTARFAADTEALERARVLIDSDAAAMDSSLREREAMLIAAREILSEHWVMGIGVAMFSLYSAPWMAGEQWHAAHNVYLEIAAEQGVVGVITHLIFLGTLARVFWRVSFKEGPAWINQAGRGAAIGAGIFAAFMVAQNGMMTHAMFYYIIGLAVSLDRLKTQA